MKCPRCNGDKSAWINGNRCDCPRCKGTGKVISKYVCPKCHGKARGKYVNEEGDKPTWHDRTVHLEIDCSSCGKNTVWSGPNCYYNDGDELAEYGITHHDMGYDGDG